MQIYTYIDQKLKQSTEKQIQGKSNQYLAFPISYAFCLNTKHVCIVFSLDARFLRFKPNKMNKVQYHYITQ